VDLWLKKFPEDENKISKTTQLCFLNSKYFRFLVLFFIGNLVPFYVLYRPAALFSPGYGNLYKKYTDGWILALVITVIIIGFGYINRKKIIYLISAFISIAYIVVLYLYPFNYFYFIDNNEHSLNDESLIYSISLIVLNIILSFYSLKKNDN
jgi:heme/copper-type cytochrome/quinol oxidase subunit 4